MSAKVVREVHRLVRENNLQGLKKLVLQHGAAILRKSHPETRLSPLITAAFSNSGLSGQTHRDIIAFLVQQGVDLNDNGDNARRVSLPCTC